MDWLIIVFLVALAIAVALSLFGRTRRQTGIAKHPIEDRPGASGAAGRHGTDIGPGDEGAREDEPASDGTR